MGIGIQDFSKSAASLATATVVNNNVLFPLPLTQECFFVLLYFYFSDRIYEIVAEKLVTLAESQMIHVC